MKKTIDFERDRESIMPPSAQPHTNRMWNELDHLAVAVSCYPPNSLERRQRLTQLVALVQRSGNLWMGGNALKEDYEEALQQTWLHVCHNIETYNPQQASVMTWINNLLRYKLLDIYRERTREQNRRTAQWTDETGELHASIENLPSPPDPPRSPSSILNEIRLWVQRESTPLRRVHVRARPDINCQVLILDRLPPAKTWEQLSQEFGGVSIQTLCNFYSRECKPRLRQFLDSEISC
jgi:DNA-directed RNA polymerase specialized sigma24 family protein